MHAIVIALLFGLSINAYNSGGVSTPKEVVQDVKAVVKEVRARDEFVSFQLND